MSNQFSRIVVSLVILTLAAAGCSAPVSQIPAPAETTIRDDYPEWIHPPMLAGACEELPVVAVEWITLRGVTGNRPVVWLKHGDTFAAILGLSNAQAEWISGIVSAQPVMRLRDVPLYRLCRFSKVTPW